MRPDEEQKLEQDIAYWTDRAGVAPTPGRRAACEAEVTRVREKLRVLRLRIYRERDGRRP